MWNRILTVALAIGCAVIGVALMIGGKGPAQSPPPIASKLPWIALPVARVPSAADEMLERRISGLDLENKTFKEAIETIAMQSRANILVRWNVLEDYGLHSNAIVRLHLWNVTVRTALRALLQMQGDRFSFEPEGEIIVVSDVEELSRHTVITAYNVRDLMKIASAPPLEFPGERIIKLTESKIDPDSWLDAGGHGRISEIGGILVISQNPGNQQKIAALLEEIREETRRLPTTRALAQ